MPRCLLLLPVLLLNLAAAPKEPPPDITFEPNITYATAAGEELKLNISRPKDATGPLPCIIVIHGGAWRAGNRDGHNDLTWLYAQKGYVSATLSYRFCPKHPFPAQVQDVKAATRFLRANASRFKLDPTRIGAVGFSAGAHLAMMLGTMDKEDGLDDVGEHQDQSSKVNAVVAFFGPTDLTTKYPDVSIKLLNDFLGGPLDQKRDDYKRASPLTYVTKGDAPTLIYQGTADPLVPWEQATLMLDAMHKAEVPGRVEIISRGNHGWQNPELQRTLDGTQAFFDQYLKATKR